MLDLVPDVLADSPGPRQSPPGAAASPSEPALSIARMLIARCAGVFRVVARANITYPRATRAPRAYGVLFELSYDVVLVLVAAFGAGLIDSMVGGGGLIQIPALFGCIRRSRRRTLLGTSKFAGHLRHARCGPRYAQRVAIPVARVVAARDRRAAHVPRWRAARDSSCRPTCSARSVPIMLLAVLIYLLWRKDLGAEHAPRTFTTRTTSRRGLIAVIGLYDGFFGPVPAAC